MHAQGAEANYSDSQIFGVVIFKTRESEMGKLDGRVAIITGGASGLGAEGARMLASEGAQVFITDVQDDLGQNVAAEIWNCRFLHQDVRSEADWVGVVDRVIGDAGRLDILVNNAGIVRFGNIETLSYSDYKLQIEVMLDGTFLGCHFAIPQMSREGSGSIINIASVGATKATSFIPAYSAAKAGIIAMTRSIAVHCQERSNGIRANAISPGLIDTPMNAALKNTDGAPQDVEIGRPVDIAHMMLYLASDDSRFVTGANMIVDNGSSIT
jgi:3(or 17)beta-hydroxysteroid dehydrogenase